MRNTSDRKKKPEKRWDSKANAAWWNDKSVSFTDYQRRQLLAICNEPEFIQAVESLGGQYLSREKPRTAPVPKPGNLDRSLEEYRSSYVDPTGADMTKTLKDLQKAKNKVQRLAATPRVHPIWKVMKDAWYAEHKKQLGYEVFERLRVLNFRNCELNGTPDDHPQKPMLQATWDNECKAYFEWMNLRWIPELIEISLKHRKKVYPEKRVNNPEHKRWLAWRLAHVLNQFGIEPTQSKEGPWALCLRIVLEASGQLDEDQSVHNFMEYIAEAIE